MARCSASRERGDAMADLTWLDRTSRASGGSQGRRARREVRRTVRRRRVRRGSGNDRRRARRNLWRGAVLRIPSEHAASADVPGVSIDRGGRRASGASGLSAWAGRDGRDEADAWAPPGPARPVGAERDLPDGVAQRPGGRAVRWRRAGAPDVHDARVGQRRLSLARDRDARADRPDALLVSLRGDAARLRSRRDAVREDAAHRLRHRGPVAIASHTAVSYTHLTLPTS